MNSTPEETTTATGPSGAHVREADELERRVFEALGTASVCWESMDGTGVFDSTRAKEVGDELVAWIRAQAVLKLAQVSTDDLMTELGARAGRSLLEAFKLADS